MRPYVVASLTLTLLACFGAGSFATAARSCGSLKAYYHENGTAQYVQASGIQATHVGCPRAREVARSWSAPSRLSGRPASSGAGLACTYRRVGSDVGTTTCVKRSGVVHFSAYDSSPFH